MVSPAAPFTTPGTQLYEGPVLLGTHNAALVDGVLVRHLCARGALPRQTGGLLKLLAVVLPVVVGLTPRLDQDLCVCDGLPKCLFLVWLINRHSLRAASCLVFKTMTYLK